MREAARPWTLPRRMASQLVTDPAPTPLTPPHPPAPTPPGDGDGRVDRYDERFVSSVAWSALAKWSAQVAVWGSTIALARLLTPADYGVLGMAAVFLGVVALLSEMGVGTSVLMLRDLSDDHVAQLNCVAAVMGVVAFGVTLLAAEPLGRVFRNEALPDVLRVLGVTFVVTGLRSVPLALLQRDLRFRRIAAVDASAAIIAAGAAVGLALLGVGYWALVGSQVVLAVVATGLTVQARPFRFQRPRWSVVGEAATFSNRVLVGRVSWYVYSNADFFVAGRMLGTAALGIYSFAWQLTSVALDRVATLVNAVTPAFFSAMQKDAAGLRRMLLGVTELLTLAVFPATVGAALVAPDLVPLVFGEKWVSAVPVVQLLAGYGLLRTMRPVLNNVLLSSGESRFLMWIGVASAVVFPLAFYLAVPYGPTGIAAAWLGLYPVSMAVAYHRVFSRGIVSPRDYLRAVLPAVNATLLMALAVLGTRELLLVTASPLVRLIAGIAVGVGVYPLTLWIFHRDRLRRVVKLVRRRSS